MSRNVSWPRKGLSRYGDFTNEAFALLRLGLPLSLTHLSYIATISTDVMMMGWLGPQALGTGSVAWYFYVFFDYFIMGLLCRVSPILSQHLGARRTKDIRPTVRAAAWTAVFLALPCCVILWNSELILVLLGQSTAIAAAAQSYLRCVLFAMLPGLWLFVISEHLAAHGRTRALLLTYVGGIGLNAVANYALMFGNFGFPALGLDGAGIATAIVYLCMFLVLTLMMGLLGTNALAANAVAAQYCAIAFATTFGLSQAATVRVGRAVGSGNHDQAALSGWIALGLGACVSLIPAYAFLFLGEPLISLILSSDDPESAAALKLAVAVLAVGGLFQVADTVQGIAIGALRGYNDTRGPLLINLAAYWGVAVPTAALLGLHLELGAQGIWLGLVAGLSTTAILLLMRLRRQTKAFRTLTL